MIGRERLAGLTVAVAVIAAATTLTGCASPAATPPTASPVAKSVPAASATARARDYLSAVSCVSSRFCVGVGSNFGTGRSLAERWNGRTWQMMAGSSATTRLGSVSCTSKSFCMAVGPGSAQVWAGKRWWALRIPLPDQLQMQSVSCARSSFCLAVGGGAAERWDGTSWRVLPVPHTGLALSSVACTRVSFCLAVGSQSNHQGTVLQSRALRWNGRAWRATHPPTPGRIAALSGVACHGTADCVAVGWHGQCHQPPQPLGQRCFFSLRWDGGSWSRLRSRAATPLVANVACGADAGCLAVGDCNLTANCRGTMALAWKGRGWRKRPALAPGRHGSSLEGVACWRRSACVATGGAVNSSGALLTLAEYWNGLRWRVLPTVSPAG